MVTTRSMSPTSRTKPWTVHSIRVSISLLQSPMVIHHLCYNHQWSFTICVTMAHSPFVLQSPIHHCNHQCHCQWWFTNPITICSGESLSFSMQVITPSQHRWVSNALPVEDDGGQVGQKNGINTTWVKGKSSKVWPVPTLYIPIVPPFEASLTTMSPIISTYHQDQNQQNHENLKSPEREPDAPARRACGSVREVARLPLTTPAR